jgi:hypothetical protein
MPARIRCDVAKIRSATTAYTNCNLQVILLACGCVRDGSGKPAARHERGLAATARPEGARPPKSNFEIINLKRLPQPIRLPPILMGT